MYETEPISEELIEHIAPVLLPVSHLRFITCDVLGLTREQLDAQRISSDAEFEADNIYQCLTLGIERKGITTVGQLENVLIRAYSDSLISADALMHLDSLKHDETHVTMGGICRQLSRYIDPSKEEKIFCDYFDLTLEEIENQSLRNVNHRIETIRLLGLWRRLNHGRNSAKHLQQILKKNLNTLQQQQQNQFVNGKNNGEDLVVTTEKEQRYIYGDKRGASTDDVEKTRLVHTNRDGEETMPTTQQQKDTFLSGMRKAWERNFYGDQVYCMPVAQCHSMYPETSSRHLAENEWSNYRDLDKDWKVSSVKDSSQGIPRDTEIEQNGNKDKERGIHCNQSQERKSHINNVDITDTIVALKQCIDIIDSGTAAAETAKQQISTNNTFCDLPSKETLRLRLQDHKLDPLPWMSTVSTRRPSMFNHVYIPQYVEDEKDSEQVELQDINPDGFHDVVNGANAKEICRHVHVEQATCKRADDMLCAISHELDYQSINQIALNVLNIPEEDIKYMMWECPTIKKANRYVLEREWAPYELFQHMIQAGCFGSSLPLSVLSVTFKSKTVDSAFLDKLIDVCSASTWVNFLKFCQMLDEKIYFSNSELCYHILSCWIEKQSIKHPCVAVMESMYEATTKGLLSRRLYGRLLDIGKKRCKLAHEMKKFSPYQITELTQQQITTIAANVPTYMMGVLAVELGMDLKTWECFVRLEDEGSPRLRMVDRFIKSDSSYTYLENGNNTLRADLQPLLDNEMPNWKELNELVNKAWPNLEEMKLHNKEDTGTADPGIDSGRYARPYYLQHMCQTMLEVMNGRTTDLAEKISNASEMLPLWYSKEIKLLLGKLSEHAADETTNTECMYYTDSSHKEDTVAMNVVANTQDNMKETIRTCLLPSDEVRACGNEEVLKDFDKYLEKRSNPEKLDYSLFGNNGYSKYKKLTSEVVEKMNSLKDHTWEAIGIAVIDSGCDQRLIAARNEKLSGRNEAPEDFVDTYGHGTLVTEIIDRYCGFVKILFHHYIVLGANGKARSCDVIDALSKILGNKHIHIVNMSLASEEYSTDYQEMLNKVGQKKIVLAASGNDLYGGMHCVYPALHPMVIAVAGLEFNFSAPVTEPFAHIRCPSHSCSEHESPCTSYATAHASALAAIVLRHAEVLDEEAKLQDRVTDEILWRVVSECDWTAEEYQAIKRALQLEEQHSDSTRCDAYLELTHLIHENVVDYYTAERIIKEILSEQQVDCRLPEFMKSFSELCWFTTAHHSAEFIKKFEEKVLLKIQDKILSKAAKDDKKGHSGGVTEKGLEDVTEMGPENVTKKGPENVTKKGPENVIEKGPEDVTEKGPEYAKEMGEFLCLKHHCEKNKLNKETLREALHKALMDAKFDHAADILGMVLKGPSRKKLLTCIEHMQGFFVDAKSCTPQDTRQPCFDVSYDTCGGIIAKFVKQNYYEKERKKTSLRGSDTNHQVQNGTDDAKDLEKSNAEQSKNDVGSLQQLSLSDETTECDDARQQIVPCKAAPDREAQTEEMGEQGTAAGETAAAQRLSVVGDGEQEHATGSYVIEELTEDPEEEQNHPLKREEAKVISFTSETESTNDS